MSDADDPKVTRLPVTTKDTERSITAVKHPEGCQHRRFTVDEREAEVTCTDCGEKLNPVWCLAHLARRETNYFRYAQRYREQMDRLARRSRTKCQHCKKMTKISET